MAKYLIRLALNTDSKLLGKGEQIEIYGDRGGVPTKCDHLTITESRKIDWSNDPGLYLDVALEKGDYSNWERDYTHHRLVVHQSNKMHEFQIIGSSKLS